MTSVIDSPRRFFAELSPITQRTASIMFDLPQPLGPTTAPILVGKKTVVGSTKDLKPASLMHLSRIEECHSLAIGERVTVTGRIIAEEETSLFTCIAP